MTGLVKRDWNSDPFVPLPAPLVDARGGIQTLVDGGIRAVQIITSSKGSVRANHYHKRDSHYLYLISGLARYYHRPVGSDQPPESVLVAAGQMIFTPSMVEHSVQFLEDSSFINITSETRRQDAYEDDLVRVELFPTDQKDRE